MQVKRNFEPEVAEKLENVPIKDLKAFLKVAPIKAEEKNTKPSKWAKMIQNIEKMDIPSDVGEHIRKTSKEFREDFCFKHDLTD